ncbi:hypothetical protein P618_201136 [Holospora obtusa F1]|uniref:Transposase n=1 Tax=Holospora obtusa F1 TaxID=1399147 RepID=W6TFC3_HOLOB|nr:hypothetical protein P618_201136 [Holospora obtusa F1]
MFVPENSSVFYEDHTVWRKSLWGNYYMQMLEQQKVTRREIRNSQESIAKSAARFNVNPKTIIKWRKREDTKDLPMGG